MSRLGNFSWVFLWCKNWTQPHPPRPRSPSVGSSVKRHVLTGTLHSFSGLCTDERTYLVSTGVFQKLYEVTPSANENITPLFGPSVSKRESLVR